MNPESAASEQQPTYEDLLQQLARLEQQQQQQQLLTARMAEERRRGEELQKIRQAAATFAELVERSPFGIYVVDSDFRVANTNAGSRDGAFRNVRPVLGRDFDEVMRVLWPEPVAAEIVGHFRHTLESGEPYYSPRFRNPRHDIGVVESYEWELHRIKLPDGRYGVTCYYYDSTHLRNAEESARESEERLRSLAENVPCVLMRFDRQLRIVYLSQQSETYNPIPVERLLGRTNREVGVPKDLCDLWDAATERVFSTGTPEEVQFDLVGPSGMRTFDLRLAPEFGRDGEVCHVLGVSTDITPRKQAEDALREANAQLREAGRRKDEFIALLSHELRNPLAPIRYAIPTLERASLPEPAARALAVIERQTAHLTRLVDDLLDVARMTTGKLELRCDYVTLETVAKAAVEAAAPAVAAGEHSLKLVMPDEPLWVYGDAARLTQIVVNLIDNAAKFTPQRGELELAVDRDGEDGIIRVRDSGVGIPGDALGKVFEMFHQVNPENRMHGGGGLGIGLGLVKQLVDLHGGQIEARSAVGQGSEFIVRLPVAREFGAEPCVRPGVTTKEGARRLKVLVVDDNADLVEMLAVFVESFGHDVRKAFDGPSAVSAATMYRPDVVLLDLGLPGMTGFDVARELRLRPETASTYLVAVTGWGQAEDVERTRSAGFSSHLTKPTEPEALRRLLNRMSEGVSGI
jgi:PAS domain S-box-containing protein